MSIYIYAEAAHARTSNLKFQDTLLVRCPPASLDLPNWLQMEDCPTGSNCVNKAYYGKLKVTNNSHGKSNSNQGRCMSYDIVHVKIWGSYVQDNLLCSTRVHTSVSNILTRSNVNWCPSSTCKESKATYALCVHWLGQEQMHNQLKCVCLKQP